MIVANQILPKRKTHGADSSFARDVLAGLSRRPKSLPPKYFYDEKGSRLFQQITQQEEYYLTRTEREILESCCGRLASRFSAAPFRLVELGAGDGNKTKLLLQHFIDAGLQFEYVPIDICRESLEELAASLTGLESSERMTVNGIVAEYFEALAALSRRNHQPTCVLFLGSNIGNFRPGGMRRFFCRLRRTLRPGDCVLTGFDLKKDPCVLERAYNDAQGATREFNFNLLDRINRELGGDFDRTRFQHRGVYNARLGRMESWLISLAEQRVAVSDVGRRFALHRGEGIHVECSYKFDFQQIERLAAASSFEVAEHFCDRRRWFVDSLWQAR